MLRISPEELSEHLNGRHRLHEHLRRRLHGWRTHLQQGRKHTFLQTLGEPQRHGWRQTHLIYLFRSANFLWNLHEDFGNIIYILLILQEPKWRRWTVVWVKDLSPGQRPSLLCWWRGQLGSRRGSNSLTWSAGGWMSTWRMTCFGWWSTSVTG